MIATDDDGQVRTVSGGTSKDRSVVLVEIQHRSTSDGAFTKRGSNGKTAAAHTGGLSDPGAARTQKELRSGGNTNLAARRVIRQPAGCRPDGRTVCTLLFHCDPDSTDKVRRIRQKVSEFSRFVVGGRGGGGASHSREKDCGAWGPELRVRCCSRRLPASCSSLRVLRLSRRQTRLRAKSTGRRSPRVTITVRVLVSQSLARRIGKLRTQRPSEFSV
jgi:hypothetical protein